MSRPGVTVRNAPLPSRAAALSFWLRTRLLTLCVLARELWRPTARRWPGSDALTHAPVLAERRSALWQEGRPEEFVLLAGKVQNLRVALPAFQGVEVAAGQTLSFWRQLGRPGRPRGFVEGREVRSGCVVPTVAGGLCQLSNALADAAHHAGLELVERHGHTARIEAAPAEAALDATVFWRHVDLKLRAPFAWRIEVELDANDLVLRLRGHAARPAGAGPLRLPPLRSAMPVARGCLSCGETACFRHRAQALPQGAQGRIAVLTDRRWPELDAAMAAHDVDWIGPRTLRLAFWRAPPSEPGAVRGFFWVALRRAIWERLWARHEGGRRQASLIDGQRWVAEAVARRLGVLHTHLVVDQGLLPHLERLGVLAGRHVEVWAPGLPLAEVHRRLDAAAERWPDDRSLRDYRAPPALVAAEARALRRAERVLTAHHAVADLHAACVPVQRLPWVRPAVSPPSGRQPERRPEGEPPALYFPGPPLGRKGRNELLTALRGLPWRLRAHGDWPGYEVEAPPAGDPLAGVAAVVLPAHVEHQPRALLAALGRGLPVVATPACGLAPQPGLMLVSEGDVAALRAALQSLAGAPLSRS